MPEPLALEGLQQLKPVDRSVSADQVATTLNIHRAALLDVHGSAAALSQRVDRMLPEMEKMLREHVQGASVQVVPLGGATELDYRFLLPDGSVRFKSGKRSIPLPDGEVLETEVPGLLDSASVTPEHEQLRKSYGAFALAYHRARREGNPWQDDLVRKSYRAFSRSMQNLPGKVGEFCRKMFSEPETYKRVIANTTGVGGELVSVPTTSNVLRYTDLARRIPGLIPMMPAPAPSFKQPRITGRALARKRGATAANPQRYTVSNFATGDTTLNVVDMAIMALLDPQWLTDAAPILGDPMGMVMDWLAAGYADTLEMAFLHADTNGQDSPLSSWTMGGMYTAGDLDGADSNLKFWIGFRARAYDDSNNLSAGGTFDISDHFGALNLMGPLANGAVAITGLKCLYSQLLPMSQFLTVQNYGPSATILTGQLGDIAGTPVVISQMVTGDLANTGLYTGSGTSTTMVYVNPQKYAYYEMAGGNDFDADRPELGARYIGMTRRGVLAPNCLSTDKPAVALYNL